MAFNFFSASRGRAKTSQIDGRKMRLRVFDEKTSRTPRASLIIAKGIVEEMRLIKGDRVLLGFDIDKRASRHDPFRVCIRRVQNGGYAVTFTEAKNSQFGNGYVQFRWPAELIEEIPRGLYISGEAAFEGQDCIATLSAMEKAA